MKSVLKKRAKKTKRIALFFLAKKCEEKKIKIKI